MGPIVFWPFCPLLRGCPLSEVRNYRKVSIWYTEPCPLFGGYFYCVPYSLLYNGPGIINDSGQTFNQLFTRILSLLSFHLESQGRPEEERSVRSLRIHPSQQTETEQEEACKDGRRVYRFDEKGKERICNRFQATSQEKNDLIDQYHLNYQTPPTNYIIILSKDYSRLVIPIN